MEQLQRILAGLSLRQKITIALAALLVAGGLTFGLRWNKERDLRPLFTNLAAEDSGAIIEKLKAANVEYKVADNGAILVPSGRVAELRLEMASAGLPRTGRLGFEIFDKTNLGTTDFAEHVNYRRALEGELERSVMALAEVERGRVHVTFAKDSVFLDNRQPAKASVLVKLKPGAHLTPQNVTAIQHLTASAVEGLAPEAVSVVDMDGTLLSKPRRDPDTDVASSSSMSEYRQSLEKEYLVKIKATLDPLLGPDKYRTGVSLDCDLTSGEQSEETFDPSRSVMLNSQRTEDASGVTAPSGVPGTASNLPRPVPRGGSTGGGVSRKTENVSYQTSRVVKHVKLPQGLLKRISISVLVDQSVRWEGAGPKARRILEPPAPEKLKVVRDVLAGVVGFQQERGDQILVETLPFEATLAAPPPEEPRKAAPNAAPVSGFQVPAWLAPLLGKAPAPVWIGAGACLVIVILLIVFLLARKLMRKGGPPKGKLVESAAALPDAGKAGARQIPAGEQKAAFEEKATAVMAANQAERDRVEREAIASLQLPPQTKKAEVLRKVIAEQAQKDPAAIAQLLRTWITEQRI